MSLGARSCFTVGTPSSHAPDIPAIRYIHPPPPLSFKAPVNSRPQSTAAPLSSSPVSQLPSKPPKAPRSIGSSSARIARASIRVREDGHIGGRWGRPLQRLACLRDVSGPAPDHLLALAFLSPSLSRSLSCQSENAGLRALTSSIVSLPSSDLRQS
jgi:hypothetical protein